MKRNDDSGYTLIELLVTMSLASIMTGIGYLNTMELSNPSLSAASEIGSFIKKTRAKALATTTSYTVSASSTGVIVATTGATCGSAQTVDPSLSLTLEHASLTDISWSLCFTSRGFPTANVVIPVTDLYAASNSVEVLLGGSIRVL